MDRVSRKLPSVKALHAFDAVCRTGGLSAAARQLSVTPGAVSRQIAILERDVGQPLFDRSPAGFRLNAAGRDLRDGVLPAFTRIENTVRRVAGGGSEATLSVWCPLSFAHLWLMPRLPRLQARGIDIHLACDGTRDAGWSNETVDVVIDVGRWPADTGLIQTAFLDDRPGLVMAAGYASAQGELDAQALVDRPDVRRVGTRSRPEIWEVWARGRGVSLPPRGSLWYDHMFLALDAVRMGLGVGIFPEVYVRDDIVAGRLRAPFGFERRQIPFYAAWPRHKTDDSRRRNFVAWLKAEAAATA